MYISILKCGRGLLFIGLIWPSVQVEFEMSVLEDVKTWLKLGLNCDYSGQGCNHLSHFLFNYDAMLLRGTVCQITRSEFDPRVFDILSVCLVQKNNA
jgi:hypothetical protein